VDRDDRNILILGGLLILLLVVGYYLLLLGPLRAEHAAAVEERSAREAQLSQLDAEVAELEAIQQDAPNIERRLLELSKRIPANPEIPTFVVQIEEVAEASGVTQVLVQPGDIQPPPGGGEFQVVPITMAFEGRYEELQDFLLRVRNLARLVTVNSVSYEPVEPEGTNGDAGEAAPGVERLLRVEIEAEVYFQPTPGVSGPAPVEAPAPPEQTAPEDTAAEDTAEDTAAEGGAGG
jgi:type IV pilus assembly protein PilO